MKVILNYGNYLCYGKQYQAKFVYESIDEATQICLWITSNQNKLLTDPVQKLTYLPKSKYSEKEAKKKYKENPSSSLNANLVGKNVKKGKNIGR